MSDTLWAEAEPILRRQAYAIYDSQPEMLLEHDGGPYSLDADVLMARLAGFEDEIVEDGLRLERIYPDLLRPIALPLRSWLTEAAAPPEPSWRAARYVLQSGWVIMPLDQRFAPPNVTPKVRMDGAVRVAYLLYRRRT